MISKKAVAALLHPVQEPWISLFAFVEECEIQDGTRKRMQAKSRKSSLLVTLYFSGVMVTVKADCVSIQRNSECYRKK